jgi:hypothetical protein
MLRILLEEVLAAYQALKLKPLMKDFVKGDGKVLHACCPLTALFLNGAYPMRGECREKVASLEMWYHRTFDRSYIIGFVHAWDGRKRQMRDIAQELKSRYKQGYMDGLALRTYYLSKGEISFNV